MDEKSYENILIYDISYKALIGATPMHIMLDEVDAFIRVYDGTRYLVLFGAEKYDAIYKTKKSGITYAFCYNYATVKIHSYDSLPLEKSLTFQNVILLTKSVFNKGQHYYYYNIFSEKCSYHLPKK